MVGVDQRAALVDVPDARRRGTDASAYATTVPSRTARAPRPRCVRPSIALALQGVEVRHGVLPDLDLEVAVRHLDGEEVA